ncbi:MAG: MFS transporter, partial [Coriobacteriales bacterium]
MVITLCLTFGFVMYDRFCITNMASFVMTDLNIDAGQLGLISSAFAIAWAFAGYFGGMAADMSKHKKRLLTIIVLLFSLLSMSTGFTQGVASVACVRVLMGIVEGPVLPLCQSHVVHESTPARRGFNQGLVQVSAVGLFSSLLGPVLSVYLAQTIGWRGSFYVTIIPGLIICVMLIFLVKEPVIRNINLADEFLTKNEDVEAVAAEQSAIDEPAAEKASIKGAFSIVKDRNIILACIAAIFILTWYLNTLTFTQPFMVMDRGFDPTPVSIIMTCLGVGAIFWGAVLPKIS